MTPAGHLSSVLHHVAEGQMLHSTVGEELSEALDLRANPDLGLLADHQLLEILWPGWSDSGHRPSPAGKGQPSGEPDRGEMLVFTAATTPSTGAVK